MTTSLKILVLLAILTLAVPYLLRTFPVTLPNEVLLPLIALGALAIVVLSVPIIWRGVRIARSGIPDPMPRAGDPAHGSADSLRTFARKQGAFLILLGCWCALAGLLCFALVPSKFGIGALYGQPALP